ncbi:DNA adenine methylase [Cryptosporangium phraense]|uniref:DNA adenine methylase n=1 Tax=Cryptosporangium phraense TaxID=2593070 RepID=UPI0014792661|nr:DNA adenine methylase [Cryptosporangium phraense]
MEDGGDGPPEQPVARRTPWDPDDVRNKPGPIENESQFAQSVVSPLRYPGAKRRLVPAIETIVQGNVPPPRLMIEPFCGGASTALRLVGTGVVEHAILADYDSLVASFWRTAVFDTAWLIDAMRDEEITVARWEWWKQASPRTVRDQALKCLFMNRTTFSGILHGRAGPIGGKKQTETTKYKIDCRFNKATLAERIEAIGKLGDTGRILDVWTSDWHETLSRIGRDYRPRLAPDEILVYLDPPYVDKSEFLYHLAFDEKQHSDLAATLNGADTYRWILSYDDDQVVRALYPVTGGRRVLHARHQYSAAALKARNDTKGRRQSRVELLVTNFPDVPESDRYHPVDDSSCDICEGRSP